MNSIDDPRLEFYLRHRELIDEWASIRSDIREAAVVFYKSLADDLEAEAASFGGHTLVSRIDGSWGHVGLVDSSWLLGDEPRVAAAIEWQRASASFTDGRRLIGIRVDPGVDGARELRRAIADRIRARRGEIGFPSSSAVWPAYRVAPTVEAADFWRDLRPYRQQLVASIRSAWDGFADDISLAVQMTPVS